MGLYLFHSLYRLDSRLNNSLSTSRCKSKLTTRKKLIDSEDLNIALENDIIDDVRNAILLGLQTFIAHHSSGEEENTYIIKLTFKFNLVQLFTDKITVQAYIYFKQCLRQAYIHIRNIYFPRLGDKGRMSENFSLSLTIEDNLNLEHLPSFHPSRSPSC